MRKFLLLLLTLSVLCSFNSADAQVLGKKKMPIGVKYYEVDILDAQSGVTKTYIFADVEGQYDIIDFKNLDTSLAAQKRAMVYDPKLKDWRLPLNKELTGIPDEKVGPLVEQYFILGQVRPSLRHRVE
jgi:hypothetical protein